MKKFLKTNEIFGSDQVYEFFNTQTALAGDFDLFKVIGGVIRSASAKGLIKPTGNYRRSKRNSGNVGLEWESTIFERN